MQRRNSLGRREARLILSHLPPASLHLRDPRICERRFLRFALIENLLALPGPKDSHNGWIRFRGAGHLPQESVGRLKDTTTYSSSTQSQTTDYVYDSKGNVVLTYVPRTWSKSDGSAVTGWTASITQYDMTGRTTDTFTATYIDGGDHTLHFTVTPTSTSTGVVAITNSVYNDATQTTSGGSVIHSSHTDFNAAGQVADAVDQYGRQTVSTYDVNGRTIRTATGLRSGTVYYGNGQVHYSGVLDPAAPANWYTQSSITSYFLFDPVSGRRQYTTYVYDLTTSLPAGAVSYDTVTDALGHVTKTYKDKLGRAFETVFDDGSSTQSLYGLGDQPVAGHEPNSSNPLIAMPGQTITGHQETKIDQMGLATDYFYDASGHLTDVWLSADCRRDRRSVYSLLLVDAFQHVGLPRFQGQQTPSTFRAGLKITR